LLWFLFAQHCHPFFTDVKRNVDDQTVCTACGAYAKKRQMVIKGF